MFSSGVAEHTIHYRAVLWRTLQSGDCGLFSSRSNPGRQNVFPPLMFYVYMQPYGHEIPALPLLPYTSLLVSCQTIPFVHSISTSSHRPYLHRYVVGFGLFATCPLEEARCLLRYISLFRYHRLMLLQVTNAHSRCIRGCSVQCQSVFVSDRVMSCCVVLCFLRPSRKHDYILRLMKTR